MIIVVTPRREDDIIYLHTYTLNRFSRSGQLYTISWFREKLIIILCTYSDNIVKRRHCRACDPQRRIIIITIIIRRLNGLCCVAIAQYRVPIHKAWERLVKYTLFTVVSCVRNTILVWVEWVKNKNAEIVLSMVVWLDVNCETLQSHLTFGKHLIFFLFLPFLFSVNYFLISVPQ